MKMLYSLLLAAAGLLAADSVPPDPEGILYTRAVKMMEEGRYAAARLTFQTLAQTYPRSAEAGEAQSALDAMLLFEDGQARLLAGKYGTAQLAFRTLVSVYPESPLVERSMAAMRESERLEEAQSSAPTIRSLQFKNTHGVKVEDILQRFREREIELGVEQVCKPEVLGEAKAALTEFLVERGVANPRVEVSNREVSPRSIEVTFRVR